MKSHVWLLMPAIFLLFALSGNAGELTMKNGDRISGRIVSESAEVVVVETAYAGTIKIARAQIERISNASSDKQSVLTIAASADPSAPAAKKLPVAVPRRLFGGRYIGLVDGWDGNANIGFSYTSGNSRTTTMLTGIRAVKSGANDNLTVYARSLWNSNRSSGRLKTTQNAFWGGARYDRNIDKKLFGFVSYDFERDRPNRLTFRSVAGGGIGRHMVKNERSEIDLLSGLAWNRTWQTGPNTNVPEALIGTSVKHKFHERLKLQNTLTYFQNITDRAEYRLIFDATVSADITRRVGVFVTVGDRYNNDPVIHTQRNDFLLTTGLKWNFGRKK
jgi:putative salt-induced outer membrane protein YdiY